MENEDVLELNWAAVNDAVRQFTITSEQETLIKTRKQELRDRLFALVEISGEEDDKGHLRLELPDPVNEVRALKIERRVSNYLDAEKAEEVLTEAGIWDDCTTQVTVLDEDKIMAARYEGKLTDEQIDAMYPQSVTEAFVVDKPRRRRR